VEIFGIGPMEFLLILIIALMVFGPDKLPEIGARLGKAMREMRQATRQFSQEIEQTRQAIEAPIQEIQASGEELTRPFQEATEATAAVSTALTHPTDLIRDSVMRNLGLGEHAAAADEPAAPTEAAAPASPAETPETPPAASEKPDAAPVGASEPVYAAVAFETPPARAPIAPAEATSPDVSAEPLPYRVPEDQLPLPLEE
jgi:TatA/E family protein of Tat protein translocase